MNTTAAPTLIFYEKPGCSSNQRQKALLREAGFILDERNLLKTLWNGPALKSFFKDLPITDWFNKSAPSIKAGIINPAQLTQEQALDAMIAEPILIRRPLMECQNLRVTGFDLPALLAELNMLDRLPAVPNSIESCSRGHAPHEPGSCSEAQLKSASQQKDSPQEVRS
jgi:nitrogenase-associated protein